MGVIDSLSKGFQTVYRRWWLVLFPVLLDSFLWIGPRMSIEDLVQGSVQTLKAELEDMRSTEAASMLDSFGTALEEVLPRYNVFAALRVGSLGIPSLVTWGGARLSSPSVYEALWVSFLGITNMPDLLVSVSDPQFIRSPVWQLRAEGTWLLLSVGLTLAGVGIGCVYLTSISRSLSSPEEAWPFWPLALRLSGRFLLFWLLRALVLIAAGIPVLLLLWILSMLSSVVALLFGTLVLGLGTWISFYGVFLIAALAMNNVSVWRAIWNSFNIVLRNFWSTLWLLILVNLIGGGLTILWQRLSTGSWLTWIAIVGNAYIGTSLVAASMAFYQDRYNRWQEALAQLLSKAKQRTA